MPLLHGGDYVCLGFSIGETRGHINRLSPTPHLDCLFYVLICVWCMCVVIGAPGEFVYLSDVKVGYF